MEHPTRKVAVLVLGMHRSGTSLLAGVLHSLGCQGPKTPVAANDRNPKGYFESQPIFRLNDEILAAAALKWDDWRPLDPGWQLSPRFNEFRDRAAELIEAEYGRSSLIYLKDPRICRILPLWRQVLEDNGYRVVCIHTHRSPVEVATSLEQRRNIEVDPSIGMLVWLRYVLEAEANSRDLPRIFTSYSRILGNWTEFSARAEERFGFSWPVISQLREERVAELIDPTLRHHDSDVAATLKNAAGPKLIVDSMRILEEWAADGEKEEDRNALDHIHGQFDLAASLFSRPLVALDKRKQEAKRLEKDLNASKAKLAELETDAESLSDTIAKQQETLVDLTRERDEIREREGILQGELQQCNDALVRIQAEADAKQAEHETEINALSDTIAAQQKSLNDLISERDKSHERENVLQKELQDHNTILMQMQATAEEKRTELEAEIGILSDNLIDRDKGIVNLRHELDAIRKEKEALEKSFSSEIRALSTQLSECQSSDSALSEARASHEAQRTALEAEIRVMADNLIVRDKTIMTLRQKLDAKTRDAETLQRKFEAEVNPAPTGRDHRKIGDHAPAHGSIEQLTPYRVSGWVLSVQGTDPVLEITVDGKIVGRAVVNPVDGGSKYIFHFRFNEPLIKRLYHVVRVYDRTSGREVPGRGFPILRNCVGRLADAHTRIEGWIDRIDDKAISGWVIDNASIVSPPMPELFVDEIRVTAIPSRYSRLDLTANGYGDARLGFYFDLQALGLNAGQHQVTIRAAGKKLPLVPGQSTQINIGEHLSKRVHVSA
ncbi:hypothetical protein [Paenirhodobacter populi]|uniref:Sulfotransferase family protein n=1 Tax=Paenirhodobacter populi TaxID=2306993 RepID=A0A443IMZ8_9RHOB|nr:hypothetical protein [Sinirhodobacter populi]RWR07267.1 hypothetical protein D2T33_17500 [Sinirhodobacter populi]